MKSPAVPRDIAPAVATTLKSSRLVPLIGVPGLPLKAATTSEASGRQSRGCGNHEVALTTSLLPQPALLAPLPVFCEYSPDSYDMPVGRGSQH